MLKMKKTIKNLLTVIMVGLLLFGGMIIPSGNGCDVFTISVAQAANKKKKLKKSDYSRLIEGGLTKKQVTELLSYIAPNEGTLKGKALDDKGKDSFMFIIVGYNIKHTTDEERLKVHSNWYDFKIKDINKYLSAFSSFRYKPNTVYQEGDLDTDSSGAYTDDEELHIYEGGIGWMKYAKITSAYYDSKEIVINFDNYCAEDKETKHQACFKKQKNGKYKLKSVKIVSQYLNMKSGEYPHYATLRGKIYTKKGTNTHGEKTTLYFLKLSVPLRANTVLKGEVTIKNVYIGEKQFAKDFVKKNVGKTIKIYGPLFEGSNGYTLAITAEEQIK